MRRFILSLLLSSSIASTPAVSADEGAASTDASVKITSQQNGQTVSIPSGTTFEVQLDGNPTTGYQWQYAETKSASVRQLTKAQYKASQPARIGSGGDFTFRFKAEKPGSATLNFLYIRPWEKNISPARTFKINVEVALAKH